jgi:DNA repair protein RadC
VRRGRIFSSPRQTREVVKEALSLIDVRVLDHLVVTGDRIVSLAELGLL